jgi:hypothetical protein
MDAIAKEQLLWSAGYYYDFDRAAYVNRREKKVFSIEAVKDHSDDWIRQRIAQPNDSGEWVFFVNQPLSPAVEEAVIAKLG